MHIAVDCRSVHPHMGGIGRAALDLTSALGQRPRGHQITMLVCAGRAGDQAVPGVRVLPVDGAMIDEAFDQFHLPGILSDLGVDLYLNTTFSVPAVKTTRLQLSIIHDVVFEDHPELVESRLCRHLSRWSRFAADCADHLITVSDFSASRICDVYGCDPSRVTRIYNGIAPASFLPAEAADVDRVRLQHGLDRPFVLYLGRLEKKKGIPELLRAFRRASEEGLSEVLVLAGSPGEPELDLQGEIERAGLLGRVRLLGFVDEGDKKALLQASALFVYPSLYEGFGIPPLEAMALGVPTIVSDRTSLPEVVGQAAIVTSVQDADAFAQALVRGLRDQEFRRAAAQDGPARARSFSWERSADEVLGLCERLGVA